MDEEENSPKSEENDRKKPELDASRASDGAEDVVVCIEDDIVNGSEFWLAEKLEFWGISPELLDTLMIQFMLRVRKTNRGLFGLCAGYSGQKCITEIQIMCICRCGLGRSVI